VEIKKDSRESGILTFTRREDPIDLTKEEVAYNFDYARALERRLSSASSQSIVRSPNKDLKIIDLDEYCEKSTQKNKNKKRYSIRNKEGKFTKKPKRILTSDSDASHISDYSEGSCSEGRLGGVVSETEGLSRDHSSYVSAKLQEWLDDGENPPKVNKPQRSA
jgi:hypothetical protein